MSNLNNLRKESLYFYMLYIQKRISEKEYIEKIRPLDNSIDILEMQELKCYLQGNLVFEKSSLEHLH